MKTRIMPFIGLISVACAFAVAPGFTSVTASVVGGGDLRVNFRATGIEPTSSSADFTVTADANATWACINRGGHNPKAANKRATAKSTVDSSVRIKPVNGSVNGSISLDAPQARNFDCPEGQVETLAAVSYTNVRISSDTLDISKRLGRTFARTFVDLR